SKSMLSGSGSLDDVSLKAVFLASMGNLTLLFLLKQVSSLASSLSAGGINASMPGSIGTLASAIKSSAKGSAGGIRAMAAGYRATKAGGQAVVRWAANKFNSIRKAG
ncbi:MAG: conjugal transfer protein TrbL, partial [Burkholderiales bacterium]